MSGQARARDTLRWGDQFAFNFNPTVLISPTQSSQLIATHWDYPLTWNVMFVGVPVLNSDETGALHLKFRVVVGVGQSQTSFIYPFSTTAGAPLGAEGFNFTGPPYNAIMSLQQIPAQDLQVTSLLTVSGLTSTSPSEQLVVGVYAAPIIESHTMRDLADRLAPGQGERQGGWMPPGFTPEHLGYKR
jgi:hypothetical protein